MAQAGGRRSARAVGLPALAALLLASFAIAFAIAVSTAVSTAVAALAPGLSGGGDSVFGAATPGPAATAVPADVRLLPLRIGGGSADLDVLSGYPQTTRVAESVGVGLVAVSVPGPHEPGAERHHQGRAPPHRR